MAITGSGAQEKLADYFGRRQRDVSQTPANLAIYEMAIRHFGRFLDRPARVADLSDAKIEQAARGLIGRGRKTSTGNRVIQALGWLARRAWEDGLLPTAPAIKELPDLATARRQPLSLDEIERLLAIGRLEPGDVAGVPAGDWWAALVLLVLNLQLPAAAVLAIPRLGLRLDRDEIAPGDGFVYAVHPVALAALKRLPLDSDQALPWTLDPGGPPHYMLFRNFNRLLRAAGIPRQSASSFERLRPGPRRALELLDGVRPVEVARLVEEFKLRSQRRAAQKAEQRRVDREIAQGRVPKAARLPKRTRSIYIIGNDSPRSLRRFFREVYRRRRLAAAEEGTLICYERAINLLADFTGAEVTLDGLARPGFLEDFQGWMLARGCKPVTVNSVLSALLALWRYAKRKEYVGGNPDFLDKLPVLKPQPEAWSLEEFGRLLTAAANLPGRFRGIPCAKLVPALCLLLFDTGLRAGAAVQLRSDELDDAGWLRVDPATQKHKSGQTFPVTPQTLDVLAAIDYRSREMLFAGPRRDRGERAPRKQVASVLRNLQCRLRRALRAAGLQSGRRDLYHKIRRTSLTYVAAVAGEEAAIVQAGHSDAAVTRLYLDPTKIGRPNVVALLPRPDWRPQGDS
ncbi:MAG TPA: site-specific integrase, partial [Pirellulales bacterium]|nr:site-specific integrase [Pirellulales bacterium]